MRRATRWLLGIPDETPSPDDEAIRLKAVRLESGARRNLAGHAEVRGRWQGGALLGTHVGAELRVSLVTPHRVPGPVASPLDICLPYLVGIGDALSSVHSDADWTGTWIAAPDGRLPSQRDDLLWLRLGGRHGLFSDRHPLVVAGVEDGYLGARAYLWDEGEPLEIDVRVGTPNDG